jgi:alpha-tubulin suppressor-like RCC1 family protein
MFKKIFLTVILLWTLQSAFAQCWLSISSGANHSAGISLDSSLYTWGANASGQLGTNDINDYSSPRKIDVNNKYIKVVCGYNSTYALRKDSTLWVCGNNSWGQLGIGTQMLSRVLTQVGGTKWIDIAAGAEFAIGTRLVTVGSITLLNTYAWGNNLNGQCGLGTSVQFYSTPTQISSLTDVKSLACGAEHTIALKTNGTLWSWGSNYSFQLGYFSAASIERAPLQIGASNNWTKIAAGDKHSLFLNTSGEVYSTGYNFFGQLGINNTTSSTILKVNGLANITNIGAGQNSSYALDANFKTYACGRNNIYQLGLSSTNNYLQFTLLTQPNADSTISIYGGEGHTLMLNNRNKLYTVGWNNLGQLGIGNTTSQSTLSLVNICTANTGGGGGVTPVATNNLCWIQASAGVSGTYAIKGDSTLWYWGSGGATTPTQVGNSKWAKVSMGTNHTLFIRQDGTLWAEGSNNYGQLGLSNAVASSPMVQIGTDNNWMEIAAGGEFSIAIKTNGILYTAGRNDFGQLAQGTGGSSTFNGFNIASAATGSTWTKAAGGYYHALAIDNAGNCYAWGRNNAYQLGNNSNVTSAVPIKIVDNIAKQVAAGEGHSAVVTTTGLLYTWGWNGVGQIGNNGNTFATTPTLIGGSPNNIQTVTCGAQFTICANAARQVYGWGDPSALRLNANISGSAQTTPRLCLTASDSVVQLTSGSGHTILIQKNGNMFAWGLNANGQLGIGTTANSTSTQLACMTSTLPLNLISFSVAQQQNMYQLQWVTKNEQNVWGFEVEQSVDGFSFNKIGFVNATNNLSNQYNFNRAANNQATVYYRLKMLDKDGKFSYSNIVSITKSKNEAYGLYPNPANSYIVITGETLLAHQVKIINASGKVEQPAIQANKLNIQHLSAGVYTILITDKNGVYQLKFIKQ